MIKRMIIMLLLVALVLGGVFGFQIFKGKMIAKYMAAAGNPAQTVSTSKATSEDWQPKLDAIGTIRAINGADLSFEVPGIVETIAFESGSDIEAGATLVHLRAEDDIAHLHSLEAAAKLAGITLERDQKQLKAQAIAQATVDADEANLNSANAQVAEQQAVVDKKTLKAPFAGHLGIRQIDLGQYLNAGVAIVTLQQLDPIYVDFTLPERALNQIASGQKVRATIEASPSDVFDGEITSINSKVDEATRNIQVRATFKNPDHKLLPGMFANISIDTGKPQHYVTLPQAAITYNPYGNTVFLVDASTPDKPTAKQTFVTTGDTRGDQIAVLTGVKDGDEVVTSGQLKLHNGSPLKINNDLQPTNDVNPKPEDK
jgi:membrane fusion protein (multidrug efflux system)